MANIRKREDRISPTSDEAHARRAETVRLRIKTAMLVEKLQNHALGKRGADMTPTQLAAAQTLLKKTIPDLLQAKGELTVSPVVFNISTTPKKS